jgi:hypothetical protein
MRPFILVSPMPQYDDVDLMNHAILRAFLANPGLVYDCPISRPPFEQDVLAAEQVEACLAFVAPLYRDEFCTAVATLDVQGEPVTVLGSDGYILFVKCARGSAFIDVDDRIVMGASRFHGQ